MQQAVVGVLVVEREQRVARGKREQLDAVMVHARLQLLLGRAVRRVHAELGTGAADAERIAPGGEDLRAVPRGHRDRIGGGHRHGTEAQHFGAVPARGALAAGRATPAGKRGDEAGQAGLQ